MTDAQLRAKLCVSIAEDEASACILALRGIAFGEVRLDAMSHVSDEELGAIFAVPSRLVATCRRTAVVCDEERERRLLVAVGLGASYVDIELDAEAGLRQRVMGAARAAGCAVIVSHHDYEATAEGDRLRAILDACYEAGADIAKVACEARTTRDVARLLGLFEDPRRKVVIGMGRVGELTRVLGPLLGGEFTFASRGQGSETAPGQLDAEELLRRMHAVLGD